MQDGPDPTVFEQSVLNSPQQYRFDDWELDASGKPTNSVFPERRKVAVIRPIPKPKKHRSG